jgi:hypothetical protein
MKYKTIVVHTDYGDDDRFSDAVNEAIGDGWKVNGAMSIAAYYKPDAQDGNGYGCRIILAQSMMKADDATA